ncbi:MAG: hypothetical protein JF616_02550 [Fibrobacteres bacterium]|jgi:hypothetical protein|nr:hypothetical protein [Fibrobacterota bacterium]
MSQMSYGHRPDLPSVPTTAEALVFEQNTFLIKCAQHAGVQNIDSLLFGEIGQAFVRKDPEGYAKYVRYRDILDRMYFTWKSLEGADKLYDFEANTQLFAWDEQRKHLRSQLLGI